MLVLDLSLRAPWFLCSYVAQWPNKDYIAQVKSAWEEGELDVVNVEQARVSQGSLSCD